MKKILNIAKKEFEMLFRTPIAYVLLFVVMCVFNYLFFLIINNNQEATLRDVFLIMEFMFIFIIPIITMKSFSEEKAAGTLEFLMTTPTTNTQIVLGKYLGNIYFLFVMIGFSLIYYIVLLVYSQPDNFAILSGYLGILLEGAMFVSVGLMASCFSRNQIVSAIISYMILFGLYFSKTLVSILPDSSRLLVSQFSTFSNLGNFLVGILSLASSLFYLSMIVLCLFVAKICIEKRKVF